MNLEFPKNINIGLPPQIKDSQNTLFEIVILIVVCGLFGWFVILPKRAEVDSRQGLLNKYSEENKKMRNTLDTLNALVREVKSHPSEIVKLDDAIPLEGKPTYLQILVQRLAESAGVTVQDVNVSGITGVVAGNAELVKNPFGTQRSLQKLSGAVYVLGNFPQLLSFLNKIETSGRVIQVSDVEIQGGQANNLSLKLVFDAYYFAP